MSVASAEGLLLVQQKPFPGINLMTFSMPQRKARMTANKRNELPKMLKQRPLTMRELAAPVVQK